MAAFWDGWEGGQTVEETRGETGQGEARQDGGKEDEVKKHTKKKRRDKGRAHAAGSTRSIFGQTSHG